jgi:hypothetical protein
MAIRTVTPEGRFSSGFVHRRPSGRGQESGVRSQESGGNSPQRKLGVSLRSHCAVLPCSMRGIHVAGELCRGEFCRGIPDKILCKNSPRIWRAGGGWLFGEWKSAFARHSTQTRSGWITRWLRPAPRFRQNSRSSLEGTNKRCFPAAARTTSSCPKWLLAWHAMTRIAEPTVSNPLKPGG